MPDSATSRFHTTSWSLVLAAGAKETAASREALAKLCRIYWQPTYVFIRRNGHDPDQAQDLTQGFFTVLLEKNYVADADPQRGRFRSYLLASVKHFLANEWDRGHALKRGGFQNSISIDPVEAETWYAPQAVEQQTPESLFFRRWAISLLEQVMGKLRAEFARTGKTQQFELLSPFLNGDAGETRYATLAAQMGASPGAMRIAVHRMRSKYKELLRAEIAETVSGPEQIKDEIRFLLSALSKT